VNTGSIEPVNLTAAETASRNITKMVLIMLLIYYIGYLPYLLHYLLTFIHISNSVFYKNFGYFSFFTNYLSRGVPIFIYYNFNNEYKKKFKFYLKKITRH
jgi:hypothetical protein